MASPDPPRPCAPADGACPVGRRAWALVALAALAALAGCGGAVPGSGPSPTRVTPAPVPSPPGTDAAQFAPGVTADGVEPARLKAAHLAALSGGRFRTERRRVVRYANGTVRSRARVRAVFAGDGRYLVSRRFDGRIHEASGTAGRTVQYGGHERTVRIDRAPNGTVLDRSITGTPARDLPRTAILPAPRAGRTVLLGLRGVEIGSVSRVGGDGPAVARIRGAGVADGAALQSLLGGGFAVDTRRVRLSAAVTRSGLITSFRFAYASTRDGVPVRVVLVATFEAVGTATLRAPDWYAPAGTDAGRETGTVTDTGTERGTAANADAGGGAAVPGPAGR